MDSSTTNNDHTMNSFSIQPSQCVANVDLMKTFDDHYMSNVWKSSAKHGVSHSGGGSDLKNVLPTIQHLDEFIRDYNISSFADIPCGDVAWQFASRELNTMNPYFGGDISKGAINENKQRFKDHPVKLFQTWDLTQCGIPKFKMMNGDDEYQAFEMAMTRDVIQHLSINSSLKLVKNVVLSGIKYWAVNSYPAAVNKGMPDATFYKNNLEIEPFNLPKENILLKTRSHQKSNNEEDNFIVFKIDENIKKIVQKYNV